MWRLFHEGYMHLTIKLLLTSLALGIPVGMAQAGTDNDIPSCYAQEKMTPPKEPWTELFVLVDQTTLLDDNLKHAILENTGRNIKPGTAYVLGSFSSFGQGHYVDVITAGRLEQPVESKARDAISVRKLRSLDDCLERQRLYASQAISAGFAKAFGGSSSDIVKSDVMASLKAFSTRIRNSNAARKIVLIASDMLENSSVSSFYSKQAVRQIDPAKELAIAEENSLFGDFGSAEIYVIGTGLLAEDAKTRKGVYRSPQTMNALFKFWQGWFERSHAKLIELGQPSLLNPIK